MRKNLKSTKFIILFVALAFLFGGVGMSLAQINTSFSDTNFEKDVVDANMIDTSAVLNEELDTIDKSIEKTSKDLDLIDDEVVRDRVDSLGIDSEKNVRTQMSELLKIIQEKDATRIQGVKKDKIQKTENFLEDNKEESEKDLSTEYSIEDINAEEDVLKNLEEVDINAEEDVLKNLEEVEINTEKDVEEIESIVLEKKRKIIDRVSARSALEDTLKDSDDDGISDFDEISIYGTDPFSADSDGDGYIDGAEVLSGFDPKNSSSDAIVIYENPQKKGIVEESLFSVGSIEIVGKEEASSGTVGTPENSVGKVSFKGQSLPNTFVTLYIFSIPTVVTVKTDEEGNWNYTMDKELENGDHEIYVAMTDNSGKIITKSNPIPFVKEAFAVTVDDEFLSLQVASSKPSFLNFGYIYITVLILVFLLGIILTIIGVRLNLRKEENTEDVY